MKTRTFLLLTAVIFTIVAVAHAVRLLLQVPVRVGTWDVPHGVSVAGALVGAALSVWAFRLARR